MVTLRTEDLPDGRMAMIEAAPLNEGLWEAWLACMSPTSGGGTAPTSPALRVHEDLDELRAWATALSIDDIVALVARHFRVP